jgi:hypothetical protein
VNDRRAGRHSSIAEVKQDQLLRMSQVEVITMAKDASDLNITFFAVFLKNERVTAYSAKRICIQIARKTN